MKTNGIFTFNAVIRLNIEAPQALHILSDPDPKRALSDWFGRNGCPLAENVSSYDIEQLKTAHGQYLSDKAVEETRLLPLSTPCNP